MMRDSLYVFFLLSMMIFNFLNASTHDPHAARLEVLFEEVINRLALSNAGIVGVGMNGGKGCSEACQPISGNLIVCCAVDGPSMSFYIYSLSTLDIIYGFNFIRYYIL
jgi:hypothetical protein